MKQLAGILLLLLGVVTTASCGHDEPDWLIGYYMHINSQVPISTEEDGQGTTSDNPAADVLSITIRNMKDAMRRAYPVNTRQGNDAAVLTACDSVYRSYNLSYGDQKRNTVCVVKIFRAHMDEEGIARESRLLTTYHLGVVSETGFND